MTKLPSMQHWYFSFIFIKLIAQFLDFSSNYERNLIFFQRTYTHVIQTLTRDNKRILKFSKFS